MARMGLIAFSKDYDDLIHQIQAALGELSSEAPKVLQKSINAAARKAQKEIVERANARYVYSAGLSKSDLKLKSARGANVSVQLTASGAMNDIMAFKVSPTALAHGKDRPSAYGAQVRSGSGLAMLTEKPKPFVTRFKSEHVALVHTVAGRKMKSNPKKDFIEKVLSLAIPHMMNTHETEEVLKVTLDERIPEEVIKQIDRILKKAGAK